MRLEDVASAAGVSAITVSRALRYPERVAASTREKIATAIEAVGYIPNLIAGGLASNSTRTIAAILPTLDNSIFTEVLQGMVDVLRPAGYQLILGNSNYSLKEEESLIEAFLARQVEGIMLTGACHTDRARHLLRTNPIPVVETWSLPESPVDLNVGFSNHQAAYEMTRYLIKKGHKQIGFVSAPTQNNDRSTQRRSGYRNALHDAGLVVCRSLELESAFGLEYGGQALETLTRYHSGMSAIFFANDILATGALLACQRRGWPVPERLAIAGFDDLEIASHIVPGLTTVRIYRREIGAEAGRLMLARIKNEEIVQPQLDLGFEIVSRESA